MKTIRAFRREFGLKVRYVVPKVHAIATAEPCRVEIEPGEEALFPAAAEWIVVERAPDDERRGMPNTVGPEARFVPVPHVVQDVGPVDVVVAPRRRRYGPNKNWRAWPWIVDELVGAGLNVFAAGAPDSSYDVRCPKAWDFDRFLDATLEAMHAARGVLSTDSGLAHLAVLCGRPLIVVTYRGRSGPGPVVAFDGEPAARDEHSAVLIGEYFEDANHTGSPILTLDGWERPADVVASVLTIWGGK